MNSRKRVIDSLRHKEPDKVPLDIGGSIISGIHFKCLNEYLKYLKISQKNEIPIVERLGTAIVPENILRNWGVDVRGIFPIEGEKKYFQDDKYLKYIDEWGITWQRPLENGLYFDVSAPALPAQDLSFEDINSLDWPEGDEEFRFKGLQEKINQYGGEYAILMEGLLGGEILDGSFWTRGYENLFCDMLLNEDEFLELLSRKLEIQKKYWRKVASKFDGKIDIVRIGDDLGEQTTTRVSPEMYRRLIKPFHKDLIDSIKSYFDTPVFIFFHSDGSIYDLIPDLIEIGVDIINPIQYTLKNMDAKKLKQEFGKDLTFWGGGIDTQHILPYGTAEQIDTEVRNQIETFSKDGGFVFCAVHNIQSDIPASNLLALLNAINRYR